MSVICRLWRECRQKAASASLPMFANFALVSDDKALWVILSLFRPAYLCRTDITTLLSACGQWDCHRRLPLHQKHDRLTTCVQENVCCRAFNRRFAWLLLRVESRLPNWLLQGTFDIFLLVNHMNEKLTCSFFVDVFRFDTDLVQPCRDHVSFFQPFRNVNVSKHLGSVFKWMLFQRCSLVSIFACNLHRCFSADSYIMNST